MLSRNSPKKVKFEIELVPDARFTPRQYSARKHKIVAIANTGIRQVSLKNGEWIDKNNDSGDALVVMLLVPFTTDIHRFALIASGFVDLAGKEAIGEEEERIVTG